MNIMVEGKASKYYTPDEVKINIEFYAKSETYKEALEKGLQYVETFINEVIAKMNFKKEDVKTQSFRVYEEKKYDYEAKKEINLGFAYSQNASLKFDYSVEKMATFIDMVNKLENPPKYYLRFGVKNIEQIKNEVLKEAYLVAKQKAEAIAEVAGQTLKECVKTDFRPFEEQVVSNTMLEAQIKAKAQNVTSLAMSSSDVIKNTFTPEDVEIYEKIYCLWLAE